LARSKWSLLLRIVRLPLQQACPNAFNACPVLLRYKQRKKWEVDDFGESMSGKSLAFGYESHWLWVWSLEIVQRCYRGVGDIHMNRGG
jgi:hypothetical protein